MPTMKYQPRLEPTARALRDALAAKGVSPTRAAGEIGLSVGAVSNWTRGLAGVSPANAKALGKLLDVDPATLVSTAKARGRPPGSKTRRKTPVAAAGPAARAVALLAAREATPHASPPLYPVERGRPLNGSRDVAPGARKVMRVELSEDGTLEVWATTRSNNGARGLLAWLMAHVAPEDTEGDTA